jgi:hypothetical protein
LSIADRCTPCRCSPRLPMPVRWLWLMPNEEPRRSRLPTPAYTNVQTLEFRFKSAISCHFWGPLACLPRGNLRSARRCSITGSDMVCTRPGHPETAWHREPSKCHYHVRPMFTIPVPTRYHGFSAVTLRAAALATPPAKAGSGQAPGLESRRHRAGRCRLMGKPSFPNNNLARPKY